MLGGSLHFFVSFLQTTVGSNEGKCARYIILDPSMEHFLYMSSQGFLSRGNATLHLDRFSCAALIDNVRRQGLPGVALCPVSSPISLPIGCFDSALVAWLCPNQPPFVAWPNTTAKACTNFTLCRRISNTTVQSDVTLRGIVLDQRTMR